MEGALNSTRPVSCSPVFFCASKSGAGSLCPLSMFRALRTQSLTPLVGVQLPPCLALQRRIIPPFPGMTSCLLLPFGQLRLRRSFPPCYLPQRPELVFGLFPGAGQALLDFTWISGHTIFVRSVSVERSGSPSLSPDAGPKPDRRDCWTFRPLAKKRDGVRVLALDPVPDFSR